MTAVSPRFPAAGAKLPKICETLRLKEDRGERQARRTGQGIG